MAMLPSSLPLGVRTVEWLRMHHFNWLVDETEHFYYSSETPAKGGAQLKTLPTVGLHAKVDHGRLSPNLNNSTEWGFTLGTRYASGAPDWVSIAAGTSSMPPPTTRR